MTVTVGAWVLWGLDVFPPGTLYSSYSTAMPRFFNLSLMLDWIFHCSVQNRGASHRIAAYKIFQSFGYYTLTMDYRFKKRY